MVAARLNNIVGSLKKVHVGAFNNLATELTDSLELATQCILEHRFVQARDILARMIDSGDEDANIYLGQAYELDPDDNPILDYKKAHFYYLQAIEATGHIEAHLRIAHMLHEGYLGEKDIQGALDIYMYLIGEGLDADGFLFFRVGVIYMLGEGVEIDLELAEEYFRKGSTFDHIPSLTLLSHLQFKRNSFLTGVYNRLKSFTLALYFSFSDTESPRTRLN